MEQSGSSQDKERRYTNTMTFRFLVRVTLQRILEDV